MQVSYPIVEGCNNGNPEDCTVCKDYCKARQEVLEEIVEAAKKIQKHRREYHSETSEAFSAMLGLDFAIASLDRLERVQYLKATGNDEMLQPIAE